MPPTYQYAGNNNTYALTTEASQSLTVTFARDWKTFKHLLYAELRPVTKSAGYYMRIGPDMGARSLYSDARHARWLDKADRPNINNPLGFVAANFKTERYNFGDTIGRKAAEQADFLLKELTQAGLGQQCMTARTNLALSALSGVSWGANTGTATALGGGNWAAGSPATPYLRKSLNAAAKQVLIATGGVVRPKDLVLVMGVGTAIGVGGSAEVTTAFNQSQFAKEAFLESGNDLNQEWGVPYRYAGYRIVVEDAVQNTAGAGIDPAMGLCLADGLAYFVCRPEGKMVTEDAEGNPYQDEEAPNVVSTLAAFAYEDMTVELFDDPRNRRLEADVVTDITFQATSNLSGFAFTSCLG